METLSIRELLDLVASNSDGGEERIQKIFEWHFQRQMEIAKWILGLAASLTVGILISFSKSEFKVELWQLFAMCFFSVATAAYGIDRIRRLHHLNREFIAVLYLYSQLNAIAAFVRRYRGLP